MSQGSSSQTSVDGLNEDTQTGPSRNWHEHLRHLLVGFVMGCVEVVPGVSGGTVALVGGVYTRLIAAVKDGVYMATAFARGQVGEGARRLRAMDWVFLLPLGFAVVVAILSLARVITYYLDEEPIKVAGLFAGMLLGSIVVAFGMLRKVDGRTFLTVAVIGVAFFAVLGLREDLGGGELESATAPLWAYPLAASVAICAWLLPGVSGALMLVMMGMYAHVMAAVDNQEMVPLALFALGAVVGVAAFSRVLSWLLEHHFDTVLTVMLGLMLGSMRVLWPWPGGVESTIVESPGDDMVMPILLAVLGFVVVAAVGRFSLARADIGPENLSRKPKHMASESSAQSNGSGR